jgi:enamine deaminase RidA (YjgF/YER057c/UK114 family)
MPRNTRRKFLAASLPAIALGAPATAAQQKPAGTAKRVYRKSTGPFKKDGPPLYSTEIAFGNLVFVSGKGAGVDAKGDIHAQTKNVLDQIEESLKIAGSSMDKVLKVTVYLSDMKDYNGMNEEYLGRFGADPPVRTTVSVVAVPDRSLVEMDCIAHL